jgi:hypothetical protein
MQQGSEVVAVRHSQLTPFFMPYCEGLGIDTIAIAGRYHGPLSLKFATS